MGRLKATASGATDDVVREMRALPGATLGQMDVHPIHPLRSYLLARQVSMEQAAPLLFVSVRTLKAIVNDWLVPVRWTDGFRRRLAKGLGFDDPDAIFPREKPPVVVRRRR